jgi:hypothetical protein
MKPKYLVRTLYGQTVFCIETNDVKVGDTIIPKSWTPLNIEEWYGDKLPTVEYIEGNDYHTHKESTSGGYMTKGSFLKVLNYDNNI